jgi:hypothetical protein
MVLASFSIPYYSFSSLVPSRFCRTTIFEVQFFWLFQIVIARIFFRILVVFFIDTTPLLWTLSFLSFIVFFFYVSFFHVSIHFSHVDITVSVSQPVLIVVFDVPVFHGLKRDNNH